MALFDGAKLNESSLILEVSCDPLVRINYSINISAQTLGTSVQSGEGSSIVHVALEYHSRIVNATLPTSSNDPSDLIYWSMYGLSNAVTMSLFLDAIAVNSSLHNTVVAQFEMREPDASAMLSEGSFGLIALCIAAILIGFLFCPLMTRINALINKHKRTREMYDTKIDNEKLPEYI